MPRHLATAVCLVLAVSACSGSEAAVTTVEPTTTSTTAAPTTTSSSTTTTEPPRVRMLRGDLPEPLLDTAETFYSWLVDRSNPEPERLRPGLVERVAEVRLRPGTERVRGGVARLGNDHRVGVVTGEDGTLVMVRTGGPWRIVAAMLPERRPWIAGAGLRTLLVLGSDARVGEEQTRLRADSIHLLTMRPVRGKGAFVGFPRDSWVGGRKLTDQMPGGGPERMVELIEDLTDLGVDGYVLVGFEGFLGLMGELGSLRIDLPEPMRSGNNWDDYPEGPQELDPKMALRLARIRKGLPAGDLDRSYNQGLVTLAAMTMIKSEGIAELPRWVAALDRHAFTDLGTVELVTWMTSAYLASPESITNLVLPSSFGRVGAASVVYLGEGAEAVYRDLEDGLIDEDH